MLLMLSVYLVCLGCGSKAENILTQHNSVDGDVTSIEIAAPYEYTWKYVPMNELAEIDPVAAQCDSRLDTSKNDYGIMIVLQLQSIHMESVHNMFCI